MRSTGSGRKRPGSRWCISRVHWPAAPSLEQSCSAGYRGSRARVRRCPQSVCAPQLMPAFPAWFWRRALASCGYSGCIARFEAGWQGRSPVPLQPSAAARRAAGTPGFPVASTASAGVHHCKPSPRVHKAARVGPRPVARMPVGILRRRRAPTLPQDWGGPGEKSRGARGGCTKACDVNATSHLVSPNPGCIVLSFLSDPG